MVQRAVIIGQGYTGRLSLVRSIASTGCDITLIVLLPKFWFERRKEKPIDAYSKYVSRVLYSENYNTEMLISILQEKCVAPDQKTILFPDNDFSAAAIDNHRETLNEHFFIPHIHERQGAIEEWMDKVRQKTLAERLGLNVAKSVIIDVSECRYNVPETIHYPCFVKPLISIVGGKSGLRRCDTEKELRDHIDFLITKHRSFRILVEDFKVIDREYATLGFSNGEEVIIPGILELLHVGHGSHFGVAVQGRVTPVNEDMRALVSQFKTLVKEIGFVGIFDIDFYKSQGSFYFCELNLRFGGSGYAFTKMGVNLPIMMMKFFSGEDYKDMNKAVSGTALYFNERMAIDDWYGGFIPLKDYLKYRKDSEIMFVEDDKDKAPQRVLMRRFGISLIKKTFRKWTGRR